MSEEEMIAEQLQKCYGLGQAIFSAMQSEIEKSGIVGEVLPDEPMDTGCFNIKQDPFSQNNTLQGEWRDERGSKKGEILFHGDGSFYAEYDIVQPHPKKKQWYIESVTAWGRDDKIKTEMKLMPGVG